MEKKREEIEKRGQMTVANKLATNTAMFIASNQMWHEMKNIVLVLSLFICYLLLVFPYIVFTKTNTILQHWKPYNLGLYRNLSKSYYEEESSIEDAQSRLTPLTRSIDMESNITLHEPGFGEVPEIKEGRADAETVFVWMRFIHFALMPLIILVLNKDIRHKAGDLLICCGNSRSNSITPRPISALLHRQNLEYNRKHSQKKFRLCDYHVPVLFATQEGLYLRILDNELATPNKESLEVEANKNNMWTIEPQFITEICDLKIESQTQLTNFSNITNEEASHSQQNVGDLDEGFHDHEPKGDPAGQERKEKKKVHFRNTVIEIAKQMNETDSGASQASEHKEYKDLRERKLTGLGRPSDDDKLSAKSHKKHRRPSFNQDSKSHSHHRRRNSEPN